MMQSLKKRSARLVVLAAVLMMAGCSDDPSEPTLDVQDVVGTYNMTVLAFDPQGVLPEMNVLVRLNTTPQLILTPTGNAQVVFLDPVSGLFRTINASFRTTATGVRLDFDSNSAYRELLFSRRMELTLGGATTGPKTLTFTAAAPDGVNRSRLLQLIPEWVTEQLLDPAPGNLRVTFST